MKKKEKSKMTKPIVLDEKIPKGVDKTLISGNSIIMTSQTVDYDEFAGKKSTTKTTSKPKQSAKTQTTSAPTKRYKVHCGGRGKTFDTLADATAFANAKQKQTKEVYAVTEYNARSSKGKDKPAAKSAHPETKEKQPKVQKATNKHAIINVPTSAITAALSEAKMKELEKSRKKREVDKLVAQGIDRKLANVMYDAYKACGVEHTLNATSKSTPSKRSVMTENFNKVKEQLKSGEARNLAFKKPMSFYAEHSADEAIKLLKAEVAEQMTKSSDNKPVAIAPVTQKQSAEAQLKRRVYKSLPQNYSVVQGTVAQSDGTILIHNAKPLFKQNKDGKMEQAKDSHGKPAHKVAALIIDPKAFNQAKNAERKLVDVEIRRHNDAKGGHPHIVVDTVNGKNVSIGISHSKKKGKNHPNIPLQHNPLGGKEQAYMKRQGTVDVKENYSSTKKTGQLTETDNEKAKKIGEKAKQKELSKKK